MAGANKKTSYSAPALEKGLDIIELLNTEEAGLTLSEIAGKLSRSTSEIFRMLAVLQRRGYLATEAGGDTYAPTMKLFELSHRQSLVKRLSSASVPVMQALTLEIEQSCHLAIYNSSKALVIAQQDCPTELSFHVRLGTSIDLLDTCSGHVLLAFSGDTTLQHRLRESPCSAAQQKALTRTLKQVRKQGFESIRSRQIKGIRDISYPVFSYTGEVIAALTVPFLMRIDNSPHADFDTVKNRLATAADTISVQLGYQPPDRSVAVRT